MRKIVIRIAVAATLLLCAGNAFAAPAKRTKIAVRQSDGTELVVSQRGDEHFHYFVTDDGLPLIQAENGDFYHAIIKGGSFVASDIMAHSNSQRTEQERTFIVKRGDISNDISNIRRANVERRNAARTNSGIRTRAGKTVRYEGNKRGLVILVNFKDNAFTIPSPKEHYERMLNEKGYSENDCHNCVSQYFSDQSNGLFNLTFDVAGPYTLAQNMEYYGGNDNSGSDKNPREMVKEACKLASADVDYSRYDWFDDGNVDMVFVVYAGYGESQGGAPETIWPHQWELGMQLQKYNGKRINVYACSSELANNTGSTPDGIGTFCHEFSHCLGLPDLYDTQNNKAFGMNRWSLMDYGTYLGAHERGECPCNYTTYERWLCGWATPTELTAATTVQGMASLDSGNTGYIIYNDAYADEYYILDNRQKQGWDTYLPGHGLLVTHIDYDEKKWYYNNVNTNAEHQRCTIIHADNSAVNSRISLAGDTYPGIAGNTELTDTSTPAAHLFNDNSSGSKYMGKPITGIAESEDGLISFKFMEGTENAIDGVTVNGESPVEIHADYRRLLPQGIRLKQYNGKTIKTIDKNKK